MWHPYGARAGRKRIVTAAVQPAVLAIVAGLCAGLALSVGVNKGVAQWAIGVLLNAVVATASDRHCGTTQDELQTKRSGVTNRTANVVKCTGYQFQGHEGVGGKGSGEQTGTVS
jgi:hypothetical protein